MSKYDRMIVWFEVYVLLLGIVLVAWSVAKVFLINWNLLTASITTLTIYINFLVGLYFIYFTMKDFAHYRKCGRIEHGFDERNVKILANSWRNAATAFVLVVFGAILYYELFYETTVPLFSIRSISGAVVPAMLVFFVSWWRYSRSKTL